MVVTSVRASEDNSIGVTNVKKKNILRVGSHDAFFVSNYFSGIVSAYRNDDSRH